MLTLDAYLAIAGYSLDLCARFRLWLGDRADEERTDEAWTGLMWAYLEERE